MLGSKQRQTWGCMRREVVSGEVFTQKVVGEGLLTLCKLESSAFKEKVSSRVKQTREQTSDIDNTQQIKVTRYQLQYKQLSLRFRRQNRELKLDYITPVGEQTREKMVRREGTRFGVITSHSVRRSVHSQQHVHSAQNVVVKAWTDVKLRRAQKQASRVVENHLQNRTLNVKGIDNEMVIPFSLNKKKRWETVNDLKKEVGDSNPHVNHMIIKEHHIGVGRHGDNSCIAVYDSMSEIAKSSPHKTYAKAKDLVAKGKKEAHPPTEDAVMMEDEDFGTKNRRRRQRKRVKVDKKTGIQEEAFTVNVSYDINVAAPRQTHYTFPKRGATNVHDENEDEILQSTKRGTKKRNKKPAHFLWDDMLSLEHWDDEEDYDDGCDDRQAEIRSSISQSVACRGVTNVLGMYLMNGTKQPMESLPKRKTHTKELLQGTKDRMFQIEKPYRRDEKVNKANTFEDEDNECLQKLVSGESILEETLKGHFGEKYHKAHCFPPRFALDITGNIIDELKKKKKSAHMCDVLLSSGYQVFTVFLPVPLPSFGLWESKVTVTVTGERFNSMDAMKILYGSPETNTVSGLVKNITKCLSDRAEDRCLYDFNPHLARGSTMSGISLETVESSLKFSSHIQTQQVVGEQILKQFCKGPTEVETGESTTVLLRSSEACCRICYSEINEMCPGTYLLACSHWFCDKCWRGYLAAKVLQGDPNINCPEFNCDSPVDPVTVMSLVPSKLSSLHWQQKVNTMVAVNKDLLWCPNADCTRVAKLCVTEPDQLVSSGLSISCDCGFFWCTKCKQEAHWPATCGQAATYRSEKSIILRSLMAGANEVFIDMVRYKSCPRCNNPIERISGCDRLVCSCKCVFCWFCGKEFGGSTDHYNHNHVRDKKEGPIAYEIFEFDHDDPLEPTYQVAIMHHFRRLKTSSLHRRLNATQLANSLAVAIYHERGIEETKAAVFAQLNTEEKGKQFLEDTNAIFRRSSDFVQEVDFVLEFVEILLAHAPPSELKKSLFQQKARLAFIAQQLDDILNRRVKLDKTCCVERVNKLYHNGKICLTWLAKSAAEVQSVVATGKKEQ